MQHFNIKSWLSLTKYCHLANFISRYWSFMHLKQELTCSLVKDRGKVTRTEAWAKQSINDVPPTQVTHHTHLKLFNLLAWWMVLSYDLHLHKYIYI